MKIKNKIILGVTSLLVLSGVSAATSTFAWYTANRQVDVSLTNITAANSITSLDVSYNPGEAEILRNTGATEPEVIEAVDPVLAETTVVDGNTNTALTFTDALTDVSSGGTGSFVKPLWGPLDSGDYATNCVGGYTDEAAYKTDDHDDASWYHQVTLNFKTSGDGTNLLSLYLDANSINTFVSDVAGSTLSVENSVRVSAVADSTLLWYANINGTETNYITTTNSATTEDTVVADNVLDNVFFTGSDYGSGDVYQGTASAVGKKLYTDPTTGYLGTLDPSSIGINDNIDVTFYIWIEGTDIDTASDAVATNDLEADFNLRLGFHSIDMGNVENTDA